MTESKKNWRYLEYLKYCVLPRASVKHQDEILKEINFLEKQIKVKK